ncbi:similar to Saccharomyces cerevisiae YLR132C Essential protein of unknown function [Maudiozyma saulgeensis]|uniref:U6 snRNA phosphodiesterase n=1 Tax=Maudiozyma saulgeensis TaxID=1789683 RepID=A0A1X7R4X5_9SACH|nr:similar to Saccharomyces cerevisiae YLR132C Essential protein of unknown function [Kazachstania saulgeensis]
MDLLKDSYNSSSEESDVNSEENELPIIPTEILNKYHIAPSTNTESNTMNYKSSLTTKIWNTFIYLEWRPNMKDRRTLDKLLDYYSGVMNQNGIHLKVEPLYWSDLGSPYPLHISLSPNIRIKDIIDRDKLFHRIESKLDKSHLKPFEVKFGNVPMCIRSMTNPKSCFFTLPIDTTTQVGPITDLVKIIEESKKGLNLETSFDLNISMTHMSIGQLNPGNGVTLDMSAINQIIQHSISNCDIPKVCINSINVDKNRQSLSIRFPE